MKAIVIFTGLVLATLLAAGCSSGGDGGATIDGKDSNNGTSTEDGGTDSSTSGSTDSATNTGGGTGTGPDIDTDECAALPYEISINPINMLILLDRSRSMVLSEVQGKTYATVVSSALKGLVSTYDATDLINFGLAAFPSVKTCLAGTITPELNEACMPASSADSPLVGIGPDNSHEIEIELDEIGVCGGTPIAASLTWAKSYIDGLSQDIKSQDTYVLLATDGAPNCNPDNPMALDKCECTQNKVNNLCPGKVHCLDDMATYNAAAQLKKDGAKVFVIGVGNQLAAWDSVMDGIAEWGGTGSYYPATDPASLSDALEAITGEAVDCTFDVNWSEVPDVDDKNNVVDKKCNKVRVFGVTTGGQKETINYSFGCQDPTGWQWQGLDKEMDPDVLDTTPLDQCRTIALCPDACKALKQSTYATVTASFGCALIPVQ